MTINLNTGPYYDDYDPTDKFNRVLFKPGSAVQARELTTLQTILQNQVEKLGSHFFKEGAPIVGGKGTVVPKNFIKINDIDAASVSIADDSLVNYVGDIVSGGTSNNKAKILNTQTGIDTDAINKKALYLNYTQGDTTGDRLRFLAGETLTVESFTGGITTAITIGAGGSGYTSAPTVTFTDPVTGVTATGTATISGGAVTAVTVVLAGTNYLTAPTISFTGGSGTGAAATAVLATTSRHGDTFVVDTATSATDTTKHYYGNSLWFAIEEGVFFLDGNFVIVDRQEINLEKFSTYSNCFIGLTLNDSIVNADADVTLNDPATGTYNFNAPGADRYKINPTLTKIALDVSPGADFLTLYTMRAGSISETIDADVAKYNALGDTLAARSFEESGNYTIKPFTIDVVEHLKTANNQGFYTTGAGGDNTKLIVKVGAGIGYIEGFRRQLETPYPLAIDKGNDFVFDEGFTIPTSYGNFVICNEVCGNWNIKAGDLIALGDTAANAITGGGHGATGFPGTAIGQARVRSVIKSSGTPGAAACTYHVYLYDIRMTAGEFKNVATLYFSDSTTSGFADPVLESSKAVLKSPNSNQLVFRTPFSSTKTLATDTGGTYDLNFFYNKQFEMTIPTGGSTTIGLTGDEQFPYSSAITQEILDSHFMFVFQEAITISGTTYDAGQVLRVTTGMLTSISSTSITVDVSSLGTIGSSFGLRAYVNIKTVDTAPVPKLLRKDRYVTIDTGTNVGGATGEYLLGVPDVFRIDSVFVGPNSGSFLSTGTDYKDQFVLDSGQTDNVYGISTISKKPFSTLNMTDKKITVKFSALYPNYGATTASYFSYNSYPIDDSGASGIFTYEIPRYSSQKLGLFKLRDCIDFRPYAEATAVDTSSLGSATNNPLGSTSLLSAGSNGFTMPPPTQAFTTDAEYYLGRVDKIIMTSTGQFKIQKGDPSTDPRVPVQTVAGMGLVDVYIAPYPSISPYLGRTTGRKDLTTKIELTQNRRYTMMDIAQIEGRISRLEYYTALSLLEKNSKDLKITDSNNADRFKNGIYVNPFDDHSLGNTLDRDYNCAIHPKLKYAKPFVYEENWVTKYNSTTSTNITRTGDLLTLPYVKTSYMSNMVASKPRNLAGELLFNYKGDMDVFPRSDNWANVEDGGTAVHRDDSLYDAISNVTDGLNNAGLYTQIDFGFAGTPSTTSSTVVTPVRDVTVTEVNATETVTSVDGSVDVPTTTTTGTVTTTLEGDTSSTTSITRDNIVMSSSLLTAGTSRGKVSTTAEFDTVVDVSFQQYMRSRVITVGATGLKPNTRMYAFFDNTHVSDFTRPASVASFESGQASMDDNYNFPNISTGVYGANLVTDANGAIAVQFLIPAQQFLVGERQFRLCDDVDNRDTFVTTAANAKYSAYGLSSVKETNIFQTQLPDITFGSVANSQQVVASVITDTATSTRSNLTMSTSVDINSTTTFPEDTGRQDPPQTPPIVTETPIPPVVDPVAPQEPPPAGDPDPVTQWLENFTMNGFLWDPLAQTFRIENREGAFIPEIDLYFRTKSNTAGVTVEIRDTVNGFPGNKLLVKKYLKASEISISTESSGTVTFVPTTFTFRNMPYLKPGVEYCMVVKPEGNSPDYNAWVSELGELQVGTSNRVLLSDTHTGVLFSSSNDRTWNAHQAEDLMFNMKRAAFNINLTGTAKLENTNVDWLTLESFTAGSPQVGTTLHGFDVTLSNGGSGQAVNDIITLTGAGGGTGAKVKVTAISGSNVATAVTLVDPGTGFTSNPGTVAQSATTGSGSSLQVALVLNRGIIEEFKSSYNVGKILIQNGGFAANDVVGNGTTIMDVVSVNNKKYNEVKTNVSFLDFPETDVTFEYAPTPSSGVSAVGSTYIPLIVGERKPTTVEMAVYSKSSETASLSSGKSFNAKSTFTSTNNYVSPMIDLSRCSFVGAYNEINNDSTGETYNTGNALSRFITKTVVLAAGQESEDLRVYLAQRMQFPSTIEVYYRVLAKEDDAKFTELDWVQMEQLGQPATGVQQEFGEFTYGIPAAKLTAGVVGYTTDRVSATTITNAGTNYSSAPAVTFSGGSPRRPATGFAVLSGTTVGSIVVTDPGRGYATAPTITLTAPGSGTTATATATKATATYAGIKAFAIKVVFLSSNTSRVPEIRELRAIALQV